MTLSLKTILAVVPLLLIASGQFLFGQGNNSNTSGRVFRGLVNNQVMPILSRQFVSGGFRESNYQNTKADRKKYKNDVDRVKPNSIRDEKEAISDVARKLQSEFDRDQLIVGSVWTGYRVLASPVSAVPYVGALHDRTMDAIEKKADEIMLQNTKQKLGYYIKQVKDKDQARFTEMIADGDRNAIRQALDDVGYIAATKYDDLGLEPEFQDVLKEYQDDVFKKSTLETLKRLADDSQANQDQIDAIDKELAGLSRFTYDFAEQTNNTLSALVQAQNDLHSDLNQFYGKYQKREGSIDFMQAFLYEKMDAGSRAQALAAGFFANLTPEERQMKIDEQNLLKKREEVVAKASEYLNTANTVSEILKDLGLADSKLVEFIDQGVGLGSGAMDAFTAFTNGNYLDCLASLTGLFGIKREDPGAVRHRQVMERFDRLDQGIARLDVKMDNLIKAQQAMMELQVATYTALVDLAERLEQNQQQLLKQLTLVEQALYENRTILREDWKQRCAICEQRIIENFQFDVDSARYPSLVDLASQFEVTDENIWAACKEYYTQIVFRTGTRTAPTELNVNFLLNSDINGILDSRRIRLLDSVYQLSHNLLSNTKLSYGLYPTDRRRTLGLLTPSISVIDLAKKSEVGLEPKAESTIYPLSLNPFLKLVNPEATITHGRIVRNIGFLYSLTTRQGELIISDNYRSINRQTLDGKRFLLDAIKLNNIGIAQQSLLSGDLLLPVIFDELNRIDANEDDSTKTKTIEYLLANNGILSENLAKYLIRGQLDHNQKTLSQYAYLFYQKDTTLMANFIDLPFKVSFLEKGDKRVAAGQVEGWHVQIGGNWYPMTNPAEVDVQIFKHSSYLPYLLNNRNQLMKMLRQYPIEGRANRELQETINYFVIRN